MQMNPNNKLWVTLLYNKYVKLGDFLNCLPSHGSPIWNSIIKSRWILKEGYQFRIGNGHSLFWYAPWTSLGPFCNSIFAIADPWLSASNQGLIFPEPLELGWDVIRTVLLDQIKDYINMLCPILNEAIQNSYVWRSNLAGIYTAKEDYKWILKHNKSSSPFELSWSWIGKLRAPEKIKLLIWSEWHDSIPTLKVLQQRVV